MDYVIKEVGDDSGEIDDVKNFLYCQIMNEYGIGPTPEFHYDIEKIKDYYILPDCNVMFMVSVNGDIVATGAIRAYDKDYEFFDGQYSKDDTASIWRLMVDEDYRRQGIARKLVNMMEDSARNAGYSKVYLHTHRYLDAAIPFWKSLGYEITLEEDDYDETTHMEKYLM